MEHRSLTHTYARARAFNCDGFPSIWICIGRDGGRVIKIGTESGETMRCVSFFPLPPLSLFLSLGSAFARGAARGNVEDEDPWNIRYALVECSFAAFAEGPGREKRKRVKRGGESLVRTDERKERGERERERENWREEDAKGFGGPVRLVNERPARLSSNPCRKQSRILTLIYRAYTPAVLHSGYNRAVAAAAPGSCSHPGEN